jgi:hypothetical protein
LEICLRYRRFAYQPDANGSREPSIWEDERMRQPDQQAIPAEPNGSDEPHDVLAAEEFAIPAPEAARLERPVVLPADPTGNSEPHDVLAAEEFAMPAPQPRAQFRSAAAATKRSRAVPLLAGAGLLALLRRRRRASRS